MDAADLLILAVVVSLDGIVLLALRRRARARQREREFSRLLERCLRQAARA